MATTTVSNVAGLVPAVIAADAFDVYTNRVVLSALAQERRELEGAVAGDRVTIGTFADAGMADELVETTAMVPVNLAATVGSFIVKEIGKAVAYTRKAGRLSNADLSRRASNAVGLAIARKIDAVLAADSYTARTTANDVASASATDPMTPAKIRAALGKFGEEGVGAGDLVLVMRSAQHTSLLGVADFTNAATYGNRDVLERGVVSRYLGIDILVSDAMPTVTNANGVNNIAFLFRRNRTLASAYSARPEIDVDYNILSREFQVAGTALWAGGLQEPRSLVAIHTTAG